MLLIYELLLENELTCVLGYNEFHLLTLLLTQL